MVNCVATEVTVMSMFTTVTLAGVKIPNREVHPKVASFNCAGVKVLHAYPLDVLVMLDPEGVGTRSNLQRTACSNRLNHIIIRGERRTSCCIAVGARSWSVIVASLGSIIAREARTRGY